MLTQQIGRQNNEPLRNNNKTNLT